MSIPQHRLLRLIGYIWLFLLYTVLAPFPKGHPINPFNSVIEPTWTTLSPETQANVYKNWLEVEPMKEALMRYVYKTDRTRQAEAKAWKAAFALMSAKAEELKDAYFDNERKPTFHIDSSDDNEDSSETRYQTGTQFKWEKFQTAFQHAVYLRLAEKRALYQLMLERARLYGKENRKEEKKIQQLKKHFEKKYLLGLEKFREKLYKVWLKTQEYKSKLEAWG